MKAKCIIVEDNVEYCREIEFQVQVNVELSVESCFHNLEDALAYLETGKSIDIVLLDIGLPVMDGITGISKILNLQPHTKIIMLTIFDDHKHVFNALKQGACGYLLKGEAEDRIKKAIEEMLSGGSFFSPTISQQVLKFFRNKPFSKTKLTHREKEVLVLMKEGLVKKQIAVRMIISYGTVDSHVKNIYKKLHVNCGVRAVMKAMDEGMV